MQNPERRVMRALLVAGLWTIAAAASAAAQPAAALEVPLVVRETEGVARLDAPVSGGIPLPIEAKITRTDQLHLLAADAETPVDCQFTVLSRWFGPPDDEARPIRWVLLDFACDVPANGSAYCFLKRVERGGPAASPLDVRDTGDRVVVATGTMTAAISKKRASLFEEVTLNAGPDGHTRVVKPDPANGLVIARTDGSRFYSRDAGAPTVVVERRGPMVAVVRVAGSLVPGTHNRAYAEQMQNLDYCVRLHFYRRRAFVRAEVRLAYPEQSSVRGALEGGGPVCHAFEDLLLRTTLALSGEVHFTAGAEEGSVAGVLDAGRDVALYQDSSGGPNWEAAPGWPTRLPGFTITSAGRAMGRGRRAPGWMDVTDGQAGLTVAVRRFWQEFPKALAVTSAGEVSVGLFPGQWAEPFRFEGGRAKRHDVLFYFHPGDAAAARSDAVARDFLHPLRVEATPDWYRDSGGVVPYAVEDEDLFGPYERLVGTIVRTTDGVGTLRHEQDATDAYGWLNFGDTYLGGTKSRRTWNNNAFDFAHALLVQSLRRQTDGWRHFQAGADLARHQIDVDTYTTARDQPWQRGGTRRPDGGGRTDHSGAPSLDETHVEGVLLYYQMTGDPWALEAARAWGRWVAANQKDPGVPGLLDRVTDLRGLGAIISGLCSLYLVTGEEAQMTLAKDCVREMVVKRLDAAGYLPDLGDRGMGTGAVSPPRMGAVAAAVGRYAAVKRLLRDPDPAAEEALARMLSFLALRAWDRAPRQIGGRTVPGALATAWYADDREREFETPAAQWAVDAFAMGYLLWNRSEHLDLTTAMVRAAFDEPPMGVYYREEQPAAARDMARLIGRGHVGMYLVQATLPRVAWLATGQNLTKHSKGPFLVRVRIRNVPAGTVPQLDYSLDNTTYHGWRDMRLSDGEVPGVWELEIPDLNWSRLAAHRLNYSVRLMAADRRILGRPRYNSELIDSLDLPPLISPAIQEIEMTAGGTVTVELKGHVRDNEDPVEALVWSVGDVDATRLAATVDPKNQRLVVTARPEASGADTITVMVRDSAGNTARQAVRVTVRPAAAPSP